MTEEYGSDETHALRDDNIQRKVWEGMSREYERKRERERGNEMNARHEEGGRSTLGWACTSQTSLLSYFLTWQYPISG